MTTVRNLSVFSSIELQSDTRQLRIIIIGGCVYLYIELYLRVLCATAFRCRWQLYLNVRGCWFMVYMAALYWCTWWLCSCVHAIQMCIGAPVHVSTFRRDGHRNGTVAFQDQRLFWNRSTRNSVAFTNGYNNCFVIVFICGITYEVTECLLFFFIDILINIFWTFQV